MQRKSGQTGEGPKESHKDDHEAGELSLRGSFLSEENEGTESHMKKINSKQYKLHQGRFRLYIRTFFFYSENNH